MSVVKVYCKIETSLSALTLTETVLEVLELPASDWPEKKIFWPISEEEEPGDSDVFLHDVVFLIDCHSCVARSTGKVSRGSPRSYSKPFHHRYFINPTNCPWVFEDGESLNF